MKLRGAAVVLGWWLSLVLAPHAAAASPALAYLAPAPCPTGDTFRAEVRSLLAGAGGRGDRYAFEVTVTETTGGFHGTLRATAPSELELSREVDDPSCSAVVHALAFIAAVTIEPRLAESAGREAAPPEPATNTPVAPNASPQLPRSNPPPVTVSTVAPSAPNDQSGAARRGRHVRGGLTGGAAATTAVAPGASFQVTAGPFAASALSGGLGWLFSLSVVHGSRSSVGSDVGSADLSWTFGRGEGCATVPVAKPLLLEPCVFLDVGSVGGTAEQPPGKSRHGLWFAPGLLDRISFEFVDGFQLFAEIGGFAPIARPSFQFTTAAGMATVHETPAFGVTGSAGLAIRML